MGQELIYLMTCSPLSHPEDLKPMIYAAIKAITPPEEFEVDYASLKFSLANGELGTSGDYMLMGLSPDVRSLMRLRDVLLVQPDSSADATTSPQP